MLNERDVLTLAAARRSDFDDWHLISEIAAKIALSLPRERFESFFVSHTRDLIRNEEYGLLTDFLEGLASNAGPDGVPLKAVALTELLVVGSAPVRQSAQALLGRVARPGDRG